MQRVLKQCYVFRKQYYSSSELKKIVKLKYSRLTSWRMKMPEPIQKTADNGSLRRRNQFRYNGPTK